MSRILIVSMPFSQGTLNPLVGVIQWVQQGGHSVGWLSAPRPLGTYEPQVRALDVEVVTTPPVALPERPSAEALKDIDTLVAYHREMFQRLPGQVDGVREAMRSFAPDVVAMNGAVFPGVVAAELEGLPWLGVCMGLQLLTPPRFDPDQDRLWSALAPVRAAAFARLGASAEFVDGWCLSPLQNVVFATEAFVGADVALPPRTRLIGPSIPPRRRADQPSFSWERLRPDRPVVYLSAGSLWEDAHLYEVVAAAAAGLGVQLVIHAGTLHDSDLVRALPGDVIAAPYVPQLDILERVSVFVTHGGANSVMEALTFGVPMLVIPQALDQPLQAYFIEKAGVGIALRRPALDVAPCRQALATLLDPQGAHRANARRVMGSYRAHDGAREAARLLTGEMPG